MLWQDSGGGLTDNGQRQNVLVCASTTGVTTSQWTIKRRRRQRSGLVTDPFPAGDEQSRKGKGVSDGRTDGWIERVEKSVCRKHDERDKRRRYGLD